MIDDLTFETVNERRRQHGDPPLTREQVERFLRERRRQSAEADDDTPFILMELAALSASYEPVVEPVAVDVPEATISPGGGDFGGGGAAGDWNGGDTGGGSDSSPGADT